MTWSPNSKEFGVVYGYMPAKTTIFNVRAIAQHTFELAPRNTILFSPHGRFVLVAGFGNLAGDMDIYDLEKNYQKVCTIKASNCTHCEWSPDGKHILTATQSPRLRVDNGIRIWHVGGGLMYHEDMIELYHVDWRPQTPLQHPLENPLHPIPTPHPSALAYLSKIKTPAKPAGAYRPPGARGSATPMLFKREDEGGAAFVNTGISSTNVGFSNGFGKPRRREVPGAEPVEPQIPGAAPGGGVAINGDEALSKAALKNKRKREAKKAKEAADKAAGLSAGGPGGPGRSPDRRDGHSRSRSRHGESVSPGRQNGQQHHHRANSGHQGQHYQGNRHAQGQQQPAPIQTQGQTPAPDVTVTSPGTGGPQEKKVRSLLKKLRAIEDLKMRQAGGEKLEDTQVKKISNEESIRKELEGLGLQQ